AAMIALIELGRIPAWIVIVIISREFIISGFRLVAADNGIVIAAGWWGKVKTTVTMIMICVVIANLGEDIPSVASGIHICEQVLIYLSLFLTVMSLIDYLIKNKGVIKTYK
ncbi:MAG: CDP-diacylglycerol--glycerol-3-phosphate 3-phosphatidyltransferase, partial [Eubacterium sp.]|nr:CDP-diacylglycerol--glycerol-3-phosphate 3-phosphatidyltransferase [Eubacterium sp.]